MIKNRKVETHTSVIEGCAFGPPASVVEGGKLMQVHVFLRAGMGLVRIIFSRSVNWPVVHARGRRYSIANGMVTRTWQPLHAASGCLADDAVYRNNRVHRFVAILGHDYVGLM